ncbi:uncharacterized protein HMPREF1541_00055 [Cyphellophora europaea CBS 101466]|uniref:WSC domain-containing protein n=1 Tax=Cyphellophora europaea (strain CBS 101466) TaxID=1220924 RepID=W2SDB7_CYPE1|nr:uncharacterized protein HMPREF1541_00055 [Cyphellophora europaea CBS 101466]ETN45874.1 hypothetical protein HMPREF1541_00055 [Cyphellophora europaea CBS 101466]
MYDLTTFAVVWLLLRQAEAFWRLPCGRIQLGRVDPIVNPGLVSGHVHTISGPNNFGVSSNYQSLTSSYCTSCPVQADKSAYWTPQLYYRYSNGTFSEVGNGGTIVYYLDRGDNLSEMIAFPLGLQMVSGDPSLRSYDGTSMTWSGKRPIADRVSFACINYQQSQAETNGLNNTDCPQGLRAQVHFPSCWDGLNLYKADQSHMAYLDRIDNGACPPTHPKLLPHLFYELYYDVAHVAKEPNGYFVFAQGDPTGYGFHGDFLNAWDEQVLTDAIAQCMGPKAVNRGGTIEACPPFAPTLDGNAGRNCPEQPPVINETVTGLIKQLPGCNEPIFGPTRATQQVCPVQPNIVASKNDTGTRKLPVPGDMSGDFAYVGCVKDSGNILNGISFNDEKMRIEACTDYCRKNKYVYAGLEGGRGCSCGNYILNALQTSGACSSPGIACSGDIGKFCGGDQVIHVYNDTKTALSPKGIPEPGKTRADLGSGAIATYTGCYMESDGRALRGDSFSDTTSMTNELCGQYCHRKGFSVYGTEYARECYCGDSHSALQVSEGNCSMICKGDTTQFCGAGNRLSLWTITTFASASSQTSTNTPAATAPTMPTVSGGSYVGCVSETSPRALNADSNTVNTQTLELCAQRAAAKNYWLFGLEYGSECYLADTINRASSSLEPSKCNMPCSGNKKQMCGGSNAISLFNNTMYSPRIPGNVQAVGTGMAYAYKGCYTDQGNPRTLGSYSTNSNSNSVDSCVSLCYSKGYSWAGVEYGSECYCNNAGPGSAALKTDSECSKPCTGNAKQNCGGSMALQVYQISLGSSMLRRK